MYFKITRIIYTYHKKKVERKEPRTLLLPYKQYVYRIRRKG